MRSLFIVIGCRWLKFDFRISLFCVSFPVAYIVESFLNQKHSSVSLVNYQAKRKEVWLY